MKLKEHVNSISDSESNFKDRWANVLELRKSAERYSKGGAMDPKNGTTPLTDFLDDVALVADLGPDEDTKGDEKPGTLKANLMTIHASKGMEFDAVFVVGNEDGTFPTQQAIDGQSAGGLDEERRLCFVAMTRAKSHLFMSWRRKTETFVGKKVRTTASIRSRFLETLMKSKEEIRHSAASTDYVLPKKEFVIQPKPTTHKTVYVGGFGVDTERFPPKPDMLTETESLMYHEGVLPEKQYKGKFIPETGLLLWPDWMEHDEVRLFFSDLESKYYVGARVEHYYNGYGTVVDLETRSRSEFPPDSNPYLDQPKVTIKFDDRPLEIKYDITNRYLRVDEPDDDDEWDEYEDDEEEDDEEERAKEAEEKMVLESLMPKDFKPPPAELLGDAV
eukprot:CAMPEP_0116836778 /NCGR_PEP_ID=MMETSP0418-20121206/8290_1 /TAXON_ID=1158023 /ORGANISM="Astrosyne radiata, Strain 13vi08-1A" /LENGTH=388 /DNA_ID=CAMNT_0004466595 /DNA_START=290 /DNA_END=1456 /DNA_ORIENTATION=+